MTPLRLAALAVLWLAGCGIYGPPERVTAPQPETPPAQGAPAEDREDPEKPQ
jgi:hypothetical protein